jgi:bifunctional non-homologous end joining protein LigD
MAKKKLWVQIGKRKIELSNLDKELFPEEGILKAEVVAYYHSLAPTILHHIKGRPLTLIRFPDGIYGENFYQKNRPEWAPDWLEFIALGKEEKKDYIVATETASLVWLANLASLELHQMHSRKPNYENPDYMVFDLDPTEGYDFSKVIELAFDLKEHIEYLGYTTFVKTTGGKGLHLVTPIEPQWDFSTVFETASAIAKPFVEKRPKETTLHIKKEARQGRVLIDIYRIRQGQSIVSPYSLRGRIGAPVSMPLSWGRLESVKSPMEFTLQNVPDIVKKEGDAWEGIDAFAVGLHTHRKKMVPAKELKTSSKHKSPEQLKNYGAKRDFAKTPEPIGKIEAGRGNAFVVHRHHASHIHYDLRLEKEGVLKSWAVPKGLPPHSGIKRLAVQTEDHPMEYLNFEGKIPKGEYGGGDMWVFAQGRYQITKLKKDGSFYFRLNSKEVNGEYRMYQIKEKEWLMERVDDSQIDWLHEPIEFMLAENVKKVPVDGNYQYEVKWDGIRAMITLDEGAIRIRSRNQNDITEQFPELQLPSSFRASCGIFDVEIVCLDKAGRPEFKKVINRLMSSGKNVIEKSAKTNPAFAYVFDCLYLDGRPLINEPLSRRRAWLEDTIKQDASFRISQTEEDGEALFEAAKGHALEGIMAKQLDSRYYPGRRSDGWFKVKVRDTVDCLIIGYTEGKGDRSKTFGALHIAEETKNGLQYRGKVGTGFNDKQMKSIIAMLSKLKKQEKPIKGKLLDEKVSVWVEPKLRVEIQYSSITKDKMFREPVFIRLREDKSN